MGSINIHAIDWRLKEVKFLIKNRGHFKSPEDFHEWILHNLEYVEKEVKDVSTMKLETTYIDFYKVKREMSSIKKFKIQKVRLYVLLLLVLTSTLATSDGL